MTDPDLEFHQHFDPEPYQRQIREKQDRLSEIAMQLDLSGRIAQLAEHPTWKDIHDRLGLIRSGELERLARDRVTEYELGKRQGRLLVLEWLTNFVRPLRSDEIEQLQAESRRLLQEIQTFQNLL